MRICLYTWVRNFGGPAERTQRVQRHRFLSSGGAPARNNVETLQMSGRALFMAGGLCSTLNQLPWRSDWRLFFVVICQASLIFPMGFTLAPMVNRFRT
jgi:hypothetical protein